jgi:hypothetical protein
MAFQTHSDPTADLDVQMAVGGDTFPVIAGPLLRASKWRGGQFVKFVASPQGDYVVEKSDGNAVAGYLLFQSENYALSPPFGGGPGSPQNFTSFQFTQGEGGQNVLTLVLGNSRSLFKIYETVALNGAGVRAGGPMVYNLNDYVKVSENGLICTDSDANLLAAGVTDPVVIGIVSAVPSASNSYRVSVDMRF